MRTSIIIDPVPPLEQTEIQPVVKVKSSEVTTVREESDETATKRHSHVDYINCREAPEAIAKVELILDPLAGIENIKIEDGENRI